MSICALVLGLVVAGAGAGSAGAKASPAGKALKSLARQTAKLPADAAPKPKRRALLKAAKHAKRTAARKPCTAVKDLDKFRKVLSKVKVKSGRRHVRAAAKLAKLGPASIDASRLLLTDSRTAECGGGAQPATVTEPQATVLASDATGLTVKVDLPEAQFVPRVDGGQSWSQLTLGNAGTPGVPGSPGIPVVASEFALPDGADVSVETSQVQGYTLKGVNLYPVQPDVVDEDTPKPDFEAGPFAEPAFTYDPAAYQASDGGPVAIGALLGTARNLVIGALRVPAATLIGSSKVVSVTTSAVVRVNFVGGGGMFSQVPLSPWERPARLLAGSLLNGSTIFQGAGYRLLGCGEEMLVITNPSTRAAADTFAAAKRNAGMRTKVVETGSGTGQIGNSVANIRDYIRGELTAQSCIHPSYVTILGDDDLVPTFIQGADDVFLPVENRIPSDLPYSLSDDKDILPDVAVGRILGDDLDALNTVVNKIITYETIPPAGDMLSHATVAAQFQDTDDPGEMNDGQEDRTFIQFAETVRNGLVRRGVTVDRLYGESPDTTPQKFNDGTALPSDLLEPTFAWDADVTDITDAWNAGRFLVVHRDHGWNDGWGTPDFRTGNVQGLTNGTLLPVLMSINCASARYDDDETSFVSEALVNPNGGAVGAFGDTRNSPSNANSQIGLGFVDALLPSVLPLEGPADPQRVGNALIRGKLRLAGIAPVGTDPTTFEELYLWHYFGDPSMQMWGGGTPPRFRALSEFTAVYTKVITGPQQPSPPPYQVNVTLPRELLGQTVSLLRDGEVIGKAVAGDGEAQIPAEFGDANPASGQLQVALEPDGSPPITVPVSGAPAATSLTQTCPASPHFNGSPMTTTGTLTGVGAGATVVVTYTRPNGTSFTDSVTTAANGSWSSTTTPGDGSFITNAGTWTIESRYAGDATHAASSASACSVVVN